MLRGRDVGTSSWRYSECSSAGKRHHSESIGRHTPQMCRANRTAGGSTDTAVSEGTNRSRTSLSWLRGSQNRPEEPEIFQKCLNPRHTPFLSQCAVGGPRRKSEENPRFQMHRTCVASVKARGTRSSRHGHSRISKPNLLLGLQVTGKLC